MSRELLSAAHQEARKGGVLAMFTIYNNPSDYPGKFVVRMLIVGHDGPVMTDAIGIADEIIGARAMVPPGLYCQQRSEGDDGPIVETWF